MSPRLLVVGGGTAAIRAIESARQSGYTGQITLVSDEAHPPYERPPLSKNVLRGAYDERTVFPRDADDLAGLDARMLLARTAVRLDREQRRVVLEDGEALSYDRLIIATGASARPLPFESPRGVHTIRTLDDSRAIARELRSTPRVVVVGAGFVGLEVASTARAMGCEVTLIESGRVPLGRALGPVMGSNCAALHEANGVQVRTHGRVVGFASSDRVTGVILEDEVIPADLVVVGIGAIPNTGWLGGSGLAVQDGVRCDADGRADESGTIFAIGDVAAWLDPDTGEHRRDEHWTSAVEQARHVGRIIAGVEVGRFSSSPYFWSDQHGVKIQMAGHARPDHHLEILHGAPAEGRFLAVYAESERLTAVLAFDEPRHLAVYMALLSRGGSLEEARGIADRHRRNMTSVPA